MNDTQRKPLVPALVVLALLAVAGCQTQQANYEKLPPQVTQQLPAQVTQQLAAAQAVSTTTNHNDAVVLREGDVVKIAFPGSPTLDTTQQIMRDGKLSLYLAGEVKAAGMTLAELQKVLLERYSPNLERKEVVVTLGASSFPVFVTGTVLRPGKVLSDHRISALEAVMEAGGFDYAKANLKSVMVIRRDGAGYKTFKLDLKKAMAGKETEPFYMEPGDIIWVREKFSVW
jgi:polysaccharide export outer membrane protein